RQHHKGFGFARRTVRAVRDYVFSHRVFSGTPACAFSRRHSHRHAHQSPSSPADLFARVRAPTGPTEKMRALDAAMDWNAVDPDGIKRQFPALALAVQENHTPDVPRYSAELLQTARQRLQRNDERIVPVLTYKG